MGTASQAIVDSTITLLLSVSTETGGVTGLAPTVAVRLGSAYLDWDDLTWKTSAWVTKYATMPEGERGHYAKELDTSLLSGVSAGAVLVAEYHVVAPAGTGDDADTFQMVDAATIPGDLVRLRKHVTNPIIETSGDPGTMTLLDDDGVTPLETCELRDKDGGPTVGIAGSPAQRTAWVPVIP